MTTDGLKIRRAVRRGKTGWLIFGLAPRTASPIRLFVRTEHTAELIVDAYERDRRDLVDGFLRSEEERP